MNRLKRNIFIVLTLFLTFFIIVFENNSVNAATYTEEGLRRQAESDSFFTNSYSTGASVDYSEYVIKYKQATCIGHHSGSGSGASGYAIQSVVDINLESGYGNGYVKVRDYMRGTHTASGRYDVACLGACAAYSTIYDKTDNSPGGMPVSYSASWRKIQYEEYFI